MFIFVSRMLVESSRLLNAMFGFQNTVEKNSVDRLLYVRKYKNEEVLALKLFTDVSSVALFTDSNGLSDDRNMSACR